MHQKARLNRIIDMSNFQKIYESIEKKEPDSDLLANIMLKISREQRLGLYRKMAAHASVSALSLGLLLSSFYYIYTNLAQSAFFDLLSLFFSDFGIVLSFWQDYLLSVLESLPLMSLMIFFASTLLLLEMARRLVDDLIIKIPHLHHEF